MADAASGIAPASPNGISPKYPRWIVFAGYGLLAAFLILSAVQSAPYFSSMAFSSETAYRYLEAGRALHESSPPQAMVYLLPETRWPNLLWLGILALMQSILPAAWFATSQSREVVVWLLQLACWIPTLLLTVRLVSRFISESWGLLSGAFMLASGALLWSVVHGSDLSLQALLVIGVAHSLSLVGDRSRRFLPGLLLLSTLSGPLGIGLALGALPAVCFQRRNFWECGSILAVTTGGTAAYLVSTAVSDPLAATGFAAGVAERLSRIVGYLLRGAWNTRLDELWRLAGSLGDPLGILGWIPGFVAFASLAFWIVPVHDTASSETLARRSLGIAMLSLIPALLFASAAGTIPVKAAIPVMLPLISITLTASVHTLRTVTQPLGVTPAALWAGVFMILELMAFPQWLGEARSFSIKQSSVADALADELEIEPAERIVLADVPIARWRFGDDPRVLSTAPIVQEHGMVEPDRLVSASSTVWLEPQLSPWKARRSPLAPWPIPETFGSNVTIMSQPPIQRWTLPAAVGSFANDTVQTHDTAIWTPPQGIDSLFSLGFNSQLTPWWETDALQATTLYPRSVMILSTESDGSGRGYSSITSPEFAITLAAFMVRLAVSQPDPDCTFRLMVWQSTSHPLAQEVEIEERVHIDLLEPGRTLEPSLFTYDCPEALNPLPDGGYEGWRVVKLVRGSELAKGLQEIRWPVSPWQGQRARWKLSDRSNTASLVLDGVWAGPTRAVRGWDFERGDYWGWTVIGEAFGKQPANAAFEGQQNVDGFQSDFFVNSYWEGSDLPTGVLISWPFPIQGDLLSFRIGGGDDPERIGLEFLVDGRKIAHATGQRDETLRPVVWDVSAFRDREGTIRILDLSSDSWGHILADDIQLWTREAAPHDIQVTAIPIPITP